MRHKVAGRRLSRTGEHRLAMRRNLVSSLFEHETVSTTIEKAKDAKPFAEKLITLAKKGTLAARRRAISLLGDRDIIEYEDEQPVQKGTVIGKLFSEIGPRYLDRPGGYTRIIKLSLKRLGDNGSVVLFQLVGKEEEASRKEAREEETVEPEASKEVTEAEEVPEAESASEEDVESVDEEKDDSDQQEEEQKTKEENQPDETQKEKTEEKGNSEEK